MVKLKSKVIRGSKKGPHLLITAGVHGDEFEGIAAAEQLSRRIEPANLRGTLTLVPVVNESAYELRSRCGSDGLDLARTCPGKPDGSVTEQVAHELSQLIRSADYYIDLHSGGVVMEVYPLAGYMLVQSDQVLEKQRRMARSFGLPLVWGTSGNFEGRSLSVARDAEIPAIYVEYRGAGRCDLSGVEALVQGCQNAMIELGILEGSVDQRTEQVVHEDRRPESGHMQINYPAPRSGLFQPSVALGEWLEKGNLLGVLSDPFTGDREEVLATEAGSVIVLRTYPQVDQGDALAVVLEENRRLPLC